MLLELLKRDLRLHYGALLVPFVLALALAFAHYFNPDLAVLGLGLGFVLAAFLPLALHLREQQLGTLGDLLSLPVSRRQIVQLRFLEAVVFPVVLLAVTGMVLALVTRTRPTLPDAGLLRAMGWALLFCFAVFLPSTLRWDGKGFLAVFGGYFVYGMGLSLTQFLPSATHLAFWKNMNRGLEHLATHPHQHSALILGLLLLCYFASIRTFASRDL